MSKENALFDLFVFDWNFHAPLARNCIKFTQNIQTSFVQKNFKPHNDQVAKNEIKKDLSNVQITFDFLKFFQFQILYSFELCSLCNF